MDSYVPTMPITKLANQAVFKDAIDLKYSFLFNIWVFYRCSKLDKHLDNS